MEPALVFLCDSGEAMNVCREPMVRAIAESTVILDGCSEQGIEH